MLEKKVLMKQQITEGGKGWPWELQAASVDMGRLIKI